jgi:hypothetical protein
VSAGAPDKCRVQSTGRQQVIHVASGAGNEAQRFFSSNAVANGRINRKIHIIF